MYRYIRKYYFPLLMFHGSITAFFSYEGCADMSELAYRLLLVSVITCQNIFFASCCKAVNSKLEIC